MPADKELDERSAALAAADNAFSDAVKSAGNELYTLLSGKDASVGRSHGQRVATEAVARINELIAPRRVTRGWLYRNKPVVS